MEQQNNAKCPLCGAELFVGYEKGTGFCPKCKKQFDVAKAIKLMKSVTEEIKEEPMIAVGEDYLEVDRILTRAEFYLERKEFENAKAELEGALKLTNTDYRVYFGLVRVETKNLTDYKNTTHKPILEKALSCADLDEKATIKRLYKDFYQLSKCSDEDIELYKSEQNDAVKAKLEKRLKQMIPSFIKMENGLKTKLILFIVFLTLGFGGMLAGFLIPMDLIMLLGVGFAILGYVFCRGYFVNKRTVKLFNAYLDYYDALDGFYFTVAQKSEVLSCMKICAKEFDQKHNERAIDTEIYRLCDQTYSTKSQIAIEFLKNHKIFSSFIGYLLADEMAE